MSVEATPSSETKKSWRAASVGNRSRRLLLPDLRLRTSERKLLLVVVDVVLLAVSLMIAWAVSSQQAIPLTSLLSQVKWYVTLLAVWLVWATFFDVYNLARAASMASIVRNVSLAVLATVLVYSLIPSLTPPLASRTYLLIFTALALVSVGAWRITYAKVFVQPWFKQQALVVGAGWAGQTLVKALHAAPQDANPFRGTGYQLLGFIDDDPTLAGEFIEDVPVLGAHTVLVEKVQTLQVNEIILAITHRHAITDALFDELLRCRELGIRVTTMTTIYERLLNRVPVQHIGRDLAEVLPMHDTAGERLFWAFKRAVDILAALLGLAVLAILAPIIALANALTSPGPLFYTQTRVGRAGKLFKVIKFRSMVPDAEKDTGAVWAGASDNRITPAGQVLRKTRLDELPQVINVLLGDMSLIGPRPERPEFVEKLVPVLPFYRARHAVRPGITGWAQVRYGYGNSVEDSLVKLELDLYYVKNANLFLDARILMQTVTVMAQFKGT